VTFSPTAGGAAGPTNLVLAVANPNGIVDPAVGFQVNNFSGTGTPAVATAGSMSVTLSPTNLGDVAIGATGTAATMTFHNTQAGDVLINGIPTASDPAFVIAAGTCTNGAVIVGNTGTCTYTVAFKPTVGTGVVFGTTTVSVNGGAITRTASLVARIKSHAILAVTPPVEGEAFGDAFVNTATPVTRSWTITNNGEGASGALTIGNSDAANFPTTGSDCGAALAIGASCTIKIGAAAKIFGALAATVTLNGTLIDNLPLPIVVANPTAKGVRAANLTVTANATATFPAPNFVGNASGAQTITVTNVEPVADGNNQTSGPLTFTLSDTANFSVADSAVNGCGPARTTGLASGASCSVDVVLTPKLAKTFAESLTITGTPGGAPTASLVGTSTSAITVDKPTQAFTATQEVTFTYTFNPGTNPTPTGTLAATLTGAQAGAWQKTGDTCTNKTFSATGLQTCTVTVKYTSGTNAANLVLSGTQPGDSVSSALTGS
jgi:hypothetical protein